VSKHLSDPPPCACPRLAQVDLLELLLPHLPPGHAYACATPASGFTAAHHAADMGAGRATAWLAAALAEDHAAATLATDFGAAQAHGAPSAGDARGEAGDAGAPADPLRGPRDKKGRTAADVAAQRGLVLA